MNTVLFWGPHSFACCVSGLCTAATEHGPAAARPGCHDGSDEHCVQPATDDGRRLPAAVNAASSAVHDWAATGAKLHAWRTDADAGEQLTPETGLFLSSYLFHRYLLFLRLVPSSGRRNGHRWFLSIVFCHPRMAMAERNERWRAAIFLSSPTSFTDIPESHIPESRKPFNIVDHFTTLMTMPPNTNHIQQPS